jgi:regulatory protein
MERSLYERAVEYVLSIPKTERQVRLWLARKNADPNVGGNGADEIIARLKECGFIDDENYAKLYVEAKRNKLGAGAIKNKLQVAGVKYDIINGAVECIGDQRNLAAVTAEKYLRNKPHTPEIKSKLFRYLLSKGFDFEQCGEVSNECWHRHCGS